MDGVLIARDIQTSVTLYPEKENRTFVLRAAKVSSEPIAEVSKFRCMRAQQRFLRSGERFYAAWRRKQQPFMQRAANLKP
ncbi:hypothetical protein [Ascidiaceihabitans sp.]|uniref:hypothetical protein n=1 Tax=Ascidiaceihabitans sp. TaxID=1872644 RepID=UPI00329997D2